MKARIDAILSEAVQRGDVPGVAAVATDGNGTIYEGGFGKTILGQGADMTPDTVVWIASMTKAVTGAVAMQQVERGTLKLDAPARDVISYLGEVQVLDGFDAEGKPRLRKPVRDITLRHLLTHTAGFGYDIWNPEILRYREVMNVPTIGTGLDRSLTTPLLFDPGARWQYGIGIDWAGKMIEAVTGRKLGQVMHDDLFGPLGMDSTGFRLTPAMRARLARVHHRKEDGSLVADLKREVPQDPEFEAGGGGLYSTANDYLKFVRMVLDGGKSAPGEAVMKPATVEAMAANAMGDSTVSLLKTVMPALSNDAEFFPGVAKQWGLSFMINNEEAPTGRSAGSLSWAGLPNTYYWIDRRKRIGGVYMTQILPFADVKSLPLFHAFESEVYAG
ncbi:serine hydrolase domain-containing protein [Reyranella sp.]|uniref:serine hydrolase domain-containing protein n=1 Tax=Reyranella sp. TaxID=1929291 RepID=UPI003BA9EE01